MNSSKKLFLYATLYKTNNIVFDLTGLDPKGGIEIYKIVKSVVKNGGSAILIDYSVEMKNDCTTFIEMQSLIKCIHKPH